jgi:hypothetical protein
MEKMQSINTAAPGCEWLVGWGVGVAKKGREHPVFCSQRVEDREGLLASTPGIGYRGGSLTGQGWTDLDRTGHCQAEQV